MYPMNLKSSIEACFNKHAFVTESFGGTAWTFNFPNGPAITGYAYIDDLWLGVDIPLDWKVTYHSALSCLRSNAVLRGAAKFSFDARRRRLHLQAEIPLIDDISPDGPLQSTLAGLRDAVSKKAGATPEFLPAERKRDSAQPVREERKRDSAEPLREDSAAKTELLAAACTEAGWTSCRKSSGALAVEIPGRHAAHAAHVALQGAGARIKAPLVPTEEFKGFARFGLSILLLSAAREARWARPYFERQKTGETAGFEVCFQSLPCATELDHAFGALSTAIRLCGEEAMVIRDDSIARQFVTIQLN
jgi:hypothetical protein